ncbi:MAG: hypothetical protein ABS81_01785 [Pseudonocardia sp. SCN 72-86]|nr:MAG: hypothetical protein ABS81_01785 [Pseudonocardia sp. SCN 72-86]
MADARRIGTCVVEEFADGKLVVVVDEHADNGALMVSAASAGSSRIAAMVRVSTGFVVAAAEASVLERLRIPRSPAHDRLSGVPDFGISVDGVGTGTGISAHARAETLRRLGNPEASASDFVRPGHVMTQWVHDSGRPGGMASAAVQLARMIGGVPVAAYAHLVGLTDPTGLASAAEARSFGELSGLEVATTSEISRLASTDLGRSTVPLSGEGRSSHLDRGRRGAGAA